MFVIILRVSLEPLLLVLHYLSYYSPSFLITKQIKDVIAMNDRFIFSGFRQLNIKCILTSKVEGHVFNKTELTFQRLYFFFIHRRVGSL